MVFAKDHSQVTFDLLAQNENLRMDPDITSRHLLAALGSTNSLIYTSSRQHALSFIANGMLIQQKVKKRYM
jgi:hypothetical protein